MRTLEVSNDERLIFETLGQVVKIGRIFGPLFTLGKFLKRAEVAYIFVPSVSKVKVTY
jgi:hypothetical protein